MATQTAKKAPEAKKVEFMAPKGIKFTTLANKMPKQLKEILGQNDNINAKTKGEVFLSADLVQYALGLPNVVKVAILTGGKEQRAQFQHSKYTLVIGVAGNGTLYAHVSPLDVTARAEISRLATVVTSRKDGDDTGFKVSGQIKDLIDDKAVTAHIVVRKGGDKDKGHHLVVSNLKEMSQLTTLVSHLNTVVTL